MVSQKKAVAKEAARQRQLRHEAEQRQKRLAQAHLKEEAAHKRVLAKARTPLQQSCCVLLSAQ